MHPGHPSAPPGPEPFNGQGMCLEFQVEDARAEHERFARERRADHALAPGRALRPAALRPLRSGRRVDRRRRADRARGGLVGSIPRARAHARLPVTGRLRWLALPAAAAVVLGASSPAIAQRAPRFLFPALAIAGAALLVRAVIRAARAHRHGTRRPMVRLLVAGGRDAAVRRAATRAVRVHDGPGRAGRPAHPRRLRGLARLRGLPAARPSPGHRRQGTPWAPPCSPPRTAASRWRATARTSAGSSWWWSTIRTATGPSTATWRRSR